MKVKRILIVVALISGGISCAYLLERGDTLKFSHKIHTKAVECKTCHERIVISEEAGGRSYPSKDFCASCHEEEFMKKCENCHTNPKKASKVSKTPTDIIFSHKAHLPRVNEDCYSCHKDILEATTSAASTIPGMDACRSCHEKEISKHLTCNYCHRRLSTKRLSQVVDFSHRGNWQDMHKEFSRREIDMKVCAQCHEESLCADCHSKREKLLPQVKFPELAEREFIHRGDFVKWHAFEQEVEQSLCKKCHGVSFCKNCHERTFRGAATAHHPAGWITSHGIDARRNMVKCASCHTEDDCISCHRVGGIGGSPHPSGWKSKRDIDDAVCRKCHKR